MLSRKIISGIMVCILGISPIVYPGLTALGYYETQASTVKPLPSLTLARVKQTNSPQAGQTQVTAVLNTNNNVKETGNDTQVAKSNNNPRPASPIPAAVNDQVHMLARIIHAEAGGEPYRGQVAVGAVILNRIRSGIFPKSIQANVFRRGEFESVSNGYIWSNPSTSSYRAAQAALSGWDPSGGAIYFYNPAKSSSKWIWTREVILKIGDHVFAR